MPEEQIALDGPIYLAQQDGLGDGNDLTVDPGDSSTDACEIAAVVHGGSCDVKFITEDVGGSELINVTITSPSGSGMVPLNPPVQLNADKRMKLKVTNTSGSSNDYATTGWEVA